MFSTADIRSGHVSAPPLLYELEITARESVSASGYRAPHWGGGSMRKILILVWNTGEFKTSLVNGKVIKEIPSPACIGIILFKLGRRGFYFWYHK